VDYLLPAGPSECSLLSLEVDADVLSEEDKLSLLSSLSSLEEASSSVESISIAGFSAFNVVAAEA
jgi:hypothetical protein